jgi:flavodoxin
MKYLVVYYSRTGNNKTIGNVIAKALSADIDVILDKKKRKGFINWLRAGRDSRGKKLTEIEFEKNPQDYDTIIIGSPIWAGKMIPPLRTYMNSIDLKGKRVAFFICALTEGYLEIFPQLKALTPESEHIGTFGITQKRFKEGDYESELEAFIELIR